MAAKECAACGLDFEQGRRRNDGSTEMSFGQHRCATCKRTICWNCQIFDSNGKNACMPCYQSGRAPGRPSNTSTTTQES